MPSIFPTACQCTQPGWCPRHNCRKDRLFFEYCRRLQAWFDLWESGGGPSALEPAPPVLLARCRQRGCEVLRHVNCDLCGGRQLPVPVFSCRVFRECTERRFGTRTAEARDMADCLSCRQYEPDDPLPAGSHLH